MHARQNASMLQCVAMHAQKDGNNHGIRRILFHLLCPLQKQDTTKITELSGIWPKHSRIRNRLPFARSEQLRKQYCTLKMF